ncbi:hypothetical protein AUC70_03250 [Methyloceanibacter stevinii]|uniref:Glycosyltransferase 2-like domain-containing protein n=1 Tax=Methyloceanibacter stevinii TaxID=1774970 RepID=A0A1E3VQT0_9HYPH|nr:hypothetical protein [Methyloceanibacter stevinii]ODR95888.1 hypothetical protein AUC70_03250 [Methyloceanibacter stevinii]
MAPGKRTELSAITAEWLLRNLQRVPKLLSWLITGQFHRAFSATKPYLQRLFRAGWRSSPPLAGVKTEQPEAREEETSIELVDASEVGRIGSEDASDITVIMPCIDAKAGGDTAKLLASRAGVACRIIVVMDGDRQGFVKTLNQTAERISSRYLVYVAQDAYPGRRWLRDAYDALEKTNKGLLGFNDGKWKGRIAAFGMVRVDWARHIYGGPVFCPAYKSHFADTELTVIARALDAYLYDADCVLVEYDPDKEAKRADLEDRDLFKRRFATGFDGKVSLKPLIELAEEYKVSKFRTATRHP